MNIKKKIWRTRKVLYYILRSFFLSCWFLIICASYYRKIFFIDYFLLIRTYFSFTAKLFSSWKNIFFKYFLGTRWTYKTFEYMRGNYTLWKPCQHVYYCTSDFLCLVTLVHYSSQVIYYTGLACMFHAYVPCNLTF